MGAGHRARGDRGGARRLWARLGRNGACGGRGSEADDDASVAHAPLPVNRSNTTGDRLFAECQVVCRVLFFGHSAKTPLTSVFFDTRQRSSLPSVFFTLGKENFKAHFEAVN